MTEREVPDSIMKQKRHWLMAYSIWISIHYALGGLATVAAALVAFSEQIGPLREYVTLLGIAACVSSALAMFCNASKKASAFFKAHRELNKAIIKYKTVDDYPIQELLTAHDEGEVIISTVDE